LAACAPTASTTQRFGYGADSQPTGYCEEFYKANPDVVDYGHQRVTDPTYILVDWNDFHTLEQRYLNEGYIRVGTSSWSASGFDSGIPQKQYAINFAKKIEADRVIYILKPGTMPTAVPLVTGAITMYSDFDRIAGATQGTPDEHLVAFYAKSR
jgi:hypothetical protein